MSKFKLKNTFLLLVFSTKLLSKITEFSAIWQQYCRSQGSFHNPLPPPPGYLERSAELLRHYNTWARRGGGGVTCQRLKIHGKNEGVHTEGCGCGFSSPNGQRCGTEMRMCKLCIANLQSSDD